MKKSLIILAVAIVILSVGIYSGYKWLFPAPKPTVAEEEEDISELPLADPSITAELKRSTTKDNSVVLTVRGLTNKVTELKYEFEYDSEGIVRGVNSGNAALSVAGKDIFEKEIYLGTCSKNVCSPDKGVKKVSVVLIFTGTDGNKSKLTKDFDL